jgi:hypothetical protein
MVHFFFYDNLTNIELIRQINEQFEIDDGYILLDRYISANNIKISIDDNNKVNSNNINILHGKIVKFDMKLEDIIMKINEMLDCINTKNVKYVIDTVLVNKKNDENSCSVFETYIIY